jgi:hypothetical protein
VVLTTVAAVVGVALVAGVTLRYRPQTEPAPISVSETPTAQAELDIPASVDPNRLTPDASEAVAEDKPALAVEQESDDEDGVDSRRRVPVADTDNHRADTIGLRVVDQETGLALEGVTVNIRAMETRHSVVANIHGRSHIKLPEKTYEYFRLTCMRDGYVGKSVEWRPRHKGHEIPLNYTVRLEPHGITLKGRVETESGLAVEGVEVTASMGLDTSVLENPHVTHPTVISDSNGYWAIAHFPKVSTEVSLKSKHPEYVQSAFVRVNDHMDGLLSGQFVLKVQKGLIISGTVLDEEGHLVSGAKVMQGFSPYSDLPETVTDANGYYCFSHCKPDRHELTVQAKGYAPDMKVIELQKDEPELDFVLEPGRSVQYTVVDQDGEPVQGAKVKATSWRFVSPSNRSQRLDHLGRTNAQGGLHFEDLPVDEVVFSIAKQGFATQEKTVVVGDVTEPVTVTLWPQGKITFSLFDAETGDPIMEFDRTYANLWPGRTDIVWQGLHTKHIKTGHYTHHERGCQLGVSCSVEVGLCKRENSRVDCSLARYPGRYLVFSEPCLARGLHGVWRLALLIAH